MHRIILLLIIFLSCQKKEKNPDETNSESHWLTYCEKNEDCQGSSQCICNTCNILCGQNNICGVIQENTVCVSSEEKAQQRQCNYEKNENICMMPCLEDAQCLSGSKCIENYCVNEGGCQNKNYWNLNESTTFTYAIGEDNLLMELDERGAPGELVVRICTEDGSSISPDIVMKVSGLGRWQDQTFGERVIQTFANDSCSAWFTLMSPESVTESNDFLIGYSTAVNPPSCAETYGFECENLLVEECGNCSFARWYALRSCRD
jgi:hypothetical protein